VLSGLLASTPQSSQGECAARSKLGSRAAVHRSAVSPITETPAILALGATITIGHRTGNWVECCSGHEALRYSAAVRQLYGLFGSKLLDQHSRLI
jgi:hypothetical protein